MYKETNEAKDMKIGADVFEETRGAKDLEIGADVHKETYGAKDLETGAASGENRLVDGHLVGQKRITSMEVYRCSVPLVVSGCRPGTISVSLFLQLS